MIQTRTVTLEIPVPNLSLKHLWLTLVALTAGDALTTIVALSIGLPEANPIITAAIDTVGLGGVVLSQAVYVGLAWGVLKITDSGHKWVLLAGILLSALVVLNNTAAIIVLSGVLA